MKAMEVAIPKNIQEPYAITVQSLAIDDRCGTIAITQPMQHTLVNVTCVINPGILIDVCRELREGHTAVVQVVHQMSIQMSMMQKQIDLMATRLPIPDTHDETLAAPEVECNKKGCKRTVSSKRFRSGTRLLKQCLECMTLAKKPVIDVENPDY